MSTFAKALVDEAKITIVSVRNSRLKSTLSYMRANWVAYV